MRERLARRGSIAAMALLGVLAAVGVGYAAIPSSDGVIHGCYKAGSNPSGQLRVIDAEAGAKCANNEKALEFNQQGPKGDTGPIGPAGPGARRFEYDALIDLELPIPVHPLLSIGPLELSLRCSRSVLGARAFLEFFIESRADGRLTTSYISEQGDSMGNPFFDSDVESVEVAAGAAPHRVTFLGNAKRGHITAQAGWDDGDRTISFDIYGATSTTVDGSRCTTYGLAVPAP